MYQRFTLFLSVSLRVQYEVIKSIDISNVSTKDLLSYEKPKQELTQLLEKQVILYNYKDISFVVPGNGKTHIKKGNSAVDPLMLLVTITRKVTRLCAISWHSLIWSIKLYVSYRMMLMYLLLCWATVKN